MAQLTSVGGKLYVGGEEVVVASAKGLATAWVSCNMGTGVIEDSFNISSVVNTGLGSADVTFSTPMDNINYTVEISSEYRSGNTKDIGVSLGTKTINGFTFAGHSGGSAFNFQEVSICIHGGKN